MGHEVSGRGGEREGEREREREREYTCVLCAYNYLQMLYLERERVKEE